MSGWKGNAPSLHTGSVHALITLQPLTVSISSPRQEKTYKKDMLVCYQRLHPDLTPSSGRLT